MLLILLVKLTWSEILGKRIIKKYNLEYSTGFQKEKPLTCYSILGSPFFFSHSVQKKLVDFISYLKWTKLGIFLAREAQALLVLFFFFLLIFPKVPTVSSHFSPQLFPNTFMNYQICPLLCALKVFLSIIFKVKFFVRNWSIFVFKLNRISKKLSFES